MANQLKPLSFNFDSAIAIRAISVNGEPWFIASDVCKALQLTNPTISLKALDKDERSKLNLGRQGEANIISESGLYTLILRCRDAVIKGSLPYRFRRWVTSEVLPSIRKTGKYDPKRDNGTLADLVGTGVETTLGARDAIRSKKNAEANAANEIAEKCIPMIMSAMRKHQYHYTNENVMPSDMLPILTSDSYNNVSKKLQIYALLIELAENGHAVSGAFREVEVMAHTIRECQKRLASIEAHADYILTQSKPVF
ncbi:Bro-N domain-containing protein [Providencia rettgeri]|uniref:BRO-N domain-containing protein n=1 Tax=Providencia rettgeri TaxID=587 RepID=UPI0024A21B9D|nr:BRO family protein [Providencia rettgeri]MDL9985939.1 BRO family protein [Providencia rettgeri]